MTVFKKKKKENLVVTGGGFVLRCHNKQAVIFDE